MSASLQALEQEIITCRKCPRLVAWREEVARTKRKAYQDQTYWGKPVPGFGDSDARIIVVGLAPGAHGSNRTGRMFTGDASGKFLYAALHRAGFANQTESSQRDDGLALQDVFITAVCRCVPPQNKPTAEEIKNCLPWLQAEINLLTHAEGFVALGKVAFDTLVRMHRSEEHPDHKPVFGHNAFYRLGDGLPWLLASYHPSQQNTLTGRLTEAMFAEVWENVRRLGIGD
ncbi:MAG TPA: uracil-DNA glycosylase [Brevefilum fermentans]|jgi:uracil-DNA glycosylase family 4|nr:uracil-DNA glycosylase [Brevefilum fermentans]HQA29443.1 uracil-DNA glycosylase [Brevefilum fermentans]